MGLFDWVGDVANTVGSFLSDPLGFRNIGKGLPQSFSLNHNINVNGKLDVNVNVSGQVDVDVTVHLPELVQAARMLRDGLTKFDLTGGALQQAVNSYSESNRQRQMLLELADLVRTGNAERMSDGYFFEVSLVNDSTKLATGALPGTRLYEVPTLCQCSVTLQFNTSPLLDKTIMSIGMTPSGAPVQTPPRQEFTFRLSSIRPTNTIHIAIDQFGSADYLKECRMQIRMVKKTKNWSYTLFEHIFDGSSGPSSIDANVYIGRLSASPKLDTAKSKRLVGTIQDLVHTLELPGIPAKISTVGELAAALVDFSATRAKNTRAITDLVADLDVPNQDAHDVRTPFYLVVQNMGPGPLSAMASVAGNSFLNASLLEAKDEVAVKIPIDADFSVLMATVTRTVQVDLQALGGKSTYYRCMIQSGVPWDTKTEFTSSDFIGPKRLTHDISVFDFLIS